MGSIPGQGIKIPHAAWHDQTHKKTPTKQETLKNPNSKCDPLKTDLEHDFEGDYERLRTCAPRGKQYGITGVGRLGAAGEASHYTLKGVRICCSKISLFARRIILRWRQFSISRRSMVWFSALPLPAQVRGVLFPHEGVFLSQTRNRRETHSQRWALGPKLSLHKQTWLNEPLSSTGVPYVFPSHFPLFCLEPKHPFLCWQWHTSPWV